MEIKYLGRQSCSLKGKKETVLINPSSDFFKKDKSRIVIYNDQGQSQKDETVNGRVIVAGPGEYEIGGVEINGHSSGFGTTIYTVTIDGLVVGLVGALTESLSEKKIDKVSGVDILVVDIGGEKRVGTKVILQLAKKWGANYIVPVGYDENGDLKRFLDETDFEGLEPVESLKVESDNLPEGTEVVILKENRKDG